MSGQVLFEVGNTWSSILTADDFILHVLDRESRYPTPQAMAYEAGFKNPEQGEERGWDGWVRLLRRPKTMYPYFPTGLLPKLTRICHKMRYEPVVKDLRCRPDEGFPEFPRIELRDYQEAAVAAGERMGRGVFDMPPRSGKTRTMCELHRRISLPTIWTAPTDRIVQQTARVLEGFFGKHYVIHQIGQKDLDRAACHKVVVCTANTAAVLPQEFYNTRQMIVADEWHHGAAKTYTHQIFPKCDHIFYRYGMTGTFFRSGTDDMAMHGILSDTIYRVESSELLRRGFLVPSHVAFLPIPAKPKVRGAGSSFNGGFGQAGIHEHVYRNQLAAHAALLLHQMGRKVLILVGTKVQGRELAHALFNYLPEAPSTCRFKAVEFLSTDRDRRLQTEIIDSFLANQEVKILLGTSLLGEGVDLPDVDALVYARGEKAEVSLTQNAYRVCTAIHGKRNAIIVDFADRHHRRLMEHSQERLAVYHNEPTFSVSILDDVAQLSPWTESLGQNAHSDR